MEGRLVIGVDGGGTRSAARLCENGRTVAEARGGALNPNQVGAAASADELGRLLCCVVSGISSAGSEVFVDAACVGLSGVSYSASADIVHAAFQTANVSVRGPRILVPDAEIVLEEAFGPAAPSGIILIAGTGSIAACRLPDRSIVRTGGKNPPGGDPGSGRWIAQQVGEAGGAAVVAELARRGDRAAAETLRSAGRALARLVLDLARVACLRGGFEVRPSGGVAVNAHEVIAELVRVLADAAPLAHVGLVVSDPLGGATKIAERRAAHPEDVPPGW